MQLKELNQKASNSVGQVLTTKAARVTQIVLIVIASLLIIWDIYLYLSENDTISKVVRQSSVYNNFFVLTWIWGVLTSHLFIARKKSAKTIPEGIAIGILVLISILIYLLGEFIPIENNKEILPQYMHMILLGFGVICGYFLWPQILTNHE